MRWLLLLACVAASGCMVAIEPDAPPPPRRAFSIEGPARPSDLVIVVPGRAVAADAIAPRWRGEWQTDTGYRCSFELTLAVDGKGVVDGLFHWTLRDAPSGSTQHRRIGQVGNEWVRGAFDPATRQLTLVGYAVDAPDLLVADRYVLMVDESGAHLQGKSQGEGGLWRDRLHATAEMAADSDG